MMKKDEDKIPLTAQGLVELKEEHQKLSEEKRPEILIRMSESQSVGDLFQSDNYNQAKEELAFVDGKIAELGEVISRAVVVDKKGNCDEITLGCQITVKTGQKENVFHLVGEWEADPAIQKISHKSPLGQSLLGKRVGEKVEVEAPAGKVTYTIIKIN